ncbi:PilZ domain-containing protein [Devosia sp. CAU 1758]
MAFSSSRSPATSPLLLERRIAPRRNTLIHASIAMGFSTVPCIVRNVSETGAKLEVGRVTGIPDRFDLIVPGHRPQPCRVVWRALKELGVEYQAAPRRPADNEA